MFIFAAITTIKQSNLHPCQVISKLPSTSTVQAASENKQQFPLFTEKGETTWNYSDTCTY